MFLASSPVAVEVASSSLAICLPSRVDQCAPRMPIAATATTTSDSPTQRATSELVATLARFRTIPAYPASPSRSTFPQLVRYILEIEPMPGAPVESDPGQNRRPPAGRAPLRGEPLNHSP